jgi:DNA-binding LytR/AlgR family response regulator
VKIFINTDDKCTETEITVKCRRISNDIEKLIAAIRILDMKLTGQKDGRQFILEASDIMYIESTDKHTFLYTINDVYESPFRLYEIEAKLANLDFLRANKSCLININHIQSIKPDLDRRLIITMEKGIQLIVSRQYAAAVKKKLEASNGY